MCEADIKNALLLVGEEHSVHGLFYAHQPRADRVNREIDAAMLDIAKCGMIQISHEMWRHAIDSAYLRYLKLPCFEELRFVVRHRYTLELQPFFEYRHTIRVVRAAICGVPALA
jgi:hypothetical protein